MQTHPVEWTEEKINNFWQFASGDAHYNEIYFSNEFKKEIVRFAEQNGDLQGLVIDYGSGPGYLLEELLKKGVSCIAADSSEHSLDITKKKFSRNPLFKGTVRISKFPLEIRSESADFIFLIETIEHLTKSYLESTIKEISRILKRGGQILITTPYKEELKNGMVLCPDCGAVFHRMQHVNSFSPESLSALMESFDFKTVQCLGTTFWQDSFENKLKTVYRSVKRLLGKPDKKRHLVYLGSKR